MARGPKAGDVFTVPLTDDLVGVGQLVLNFEKAPGYFYAVAFDDTLATGDVSPDAAIRASHSSPVLMALTMDTLLTTKRWTVQASSEFDAARLRFPNYKIATGRHRFEVLDEQGKTLRRARRGEAGRLREQTFVAPIRLERALSALKGHCAWDPDFDELLLAAELGSDARSWVEPTR